MLRKTRTRGLLLAAFASIGLSPCNATAAPDEIQVYLDDMNDPGEFGVEFHTNYVLKGQKSPSYAGELPSHHLLQVTPEFSYGLSNTWEAGLYVPLALGPNGDLYNNGLKLRMKYVAPKTDRAVFFWGINTELGYATRRSSESYWNGELRPIIGYRDKTWLVAVNPILNLALSSNVSNEPNFEPSIKLGRDIGNGLQVGVEYFAELGPIHHRLPAGERSQYFYGVIDINRGPLDINFGVGRGYTNAPDTWIAKMIVEVPLK